MTQFNETSLDTLCAALCYAMGVTPPACAAAPNRLLTDYIDRVLEGKKVDRILMYNPDAVAQWVYEKYPSLVREVTANAELAIPFATVMPSVTPVCFGTMYTGAQPEVHGIQAYVKPVITIDTIFDAMIRAGKRCIIISQGAASMSRIFLERDMEYIICATVDEVNAEAARVIMEDNYDFVVVYNGNFDHAAHYCGPEDIETLGELRANSRTFQMLSHLVRRHWAKHNTLVGFAMDHGCHAVDEVNKNGDRLLGNHGMHIPEDINILHRYQLYPASK